MAPDKLTAHLDVWCQLACPQPNQEDDCIATSDSGACHRHLDTLCASFYPEKEPYVTIIGLMQVLRNDPIWLPMGTYKGYIYITLNKVRAI